MQGLISAWLFLLIETQLEVVRFSTKSLRYNESTRTAHPSGVTTIQVNKKETGLQKPPYIFIFSSYIG